MFFSHFFGEWFLFLMNKMAIGKSSPKKWLIWWFSQEKSGYDVKHMNFGWLVQWSQPESNNKETQQTQLWNLWTSILGTNKNCLEVTRFLNLKGYCFLNLKRHKNKCKGNFWSEVINPWHSTNISLGFFPAEVFHACLTQKSFAPQKNFRIFNPNCRCKFSVAACRQPIPTKLLIQNTKTYHRFLLHHPKNQLFHRFTVKNGFNWNRRAATIVFFASTNVLVEFFFSVLRDEGFQTVHIIELDTSEIMSALGAWCNGIWREVFEGDISSPYMVISLTSRITAYIVLFRG